MYNYIEAFQTCTHLFSHILRRVFFHFIAIKINVWLQYHYFGVGLGEYAFLIGQQLCVNTAD